MLDFPNTPQLGDILNGPSGQSWVWDGIKWANSIIGGAALVPEPPNDGAAYLRKNGAWVPMTTVTAFQAANISAAAAYTWYDAISVNIGNAGTWFLTGTVVMYYAGAFNAFTRFFDGTTVIVTTANSGSNWVSLSISGVVANPAGPIRLQAAGNLASTTIHINPGAANISTSQVNNIVALRIG